jgi:hypothetical protein
MISTSQRDDTFDYLKGVLVCLMVVYHVMNAATTAGPEAYTYIRFVSGSFIFVTGLIISRYVSRSFTINTRRASVKMLSRGAKLVVLFTLLNLAIHASGIGNAAKQQLGVAGFFARADAVYLRGDISISSFAILLPIGYLLIFAPLFLKYAGPTRRVATVTVLAATLTYAGVVANVPGSLIAEFMVVGIVGLCLGALPWVAPLAAQTLSGRLLSGVGLALSLWLTAHAQFNLALYSAGVALVMKFLHDAVRHFRFGNPLAQAVALVGQYSLFAYIAQIGLIHVIARLVGWRRWDLGIEAASFMFCTLALVVTSCMLLSRMREQSALVDRVYRFVFA